MLTFSKHALIRMKERQVTEEDVVQALRKAIGPPRPGSRIDTVVQLGIATNGRRLQIVLDAADHTKVVTVIEGR